MTDFSQFSSVQVIKYPIITDKTTRLLEINKYSFVVNPAYNKKIIKAAVEDLFNVKVTKVNISHIPPKKKRVGKYVGWKPRYKKAIVTLINGDTINLFAEN